MTESDVLADVRAFLLEVIGPGAVVLLTQVNRVAMPDAANFVMMTPMSRIEIGTSVDTWPPEAVAPTVLDVTQPTEFTTQLDFYGPLASDWAQKVITLTRNLYGAERLVTPLYTSGARQIPFMNAEAQYENRWIVSLVMQINPAVSTAMQFADTVAVDTILIEGIAP